MSPWIEREFLKKKEEVVIVKEKEKLVWRPISYESARHKYKFNIYWRKNGATAEYRLSQTSPGIFWNEMSGLPSGASFEEARTKEYHILRLCRDGVPQQGAFIKLKIEE